MATCRNENAFALRHRAGNAGVAVAVDTRPKAVNGRRKHDSRKQARSKLRNQMRSGSFD